jgi:hypothetical protein
MRNDIADYILDGGALDNLQSYARMVGIGQAYQSILQYNPVEDGYNEH